MALECGFWRLHEPDYPSDYQHTFVNGELEHPFGMPGVRCGCCGNTWGGGRILPYALPESLRKRKELRDGWPINHEAHRALQAEVLTALRAEGHLVEAVRPGDSFQPGVLDIPSRPEADFLWAALGSVVVSERIRTAFLAAGVKGAVFAPVTPRKIGRRSAKLPAPIPSSGEPEDLITELRATTPANAIPSLFELVVTADSGRPPGAREFSICACCGREQYDREGRQLVLLPEMWRGEDVFFLATTTHIVVTDPVRDLLRNLRATNVRLTSLAGTG